MGQISVITQKRSIRDKFAEEKYFSSAQLFKVSMIKTYT